MAPDGAMNRGANKRNGPGVEGAPGQMEQTTMEQKKNNTGQARELTVAEAAELEAKYPTDASTESCGETGISAGSVKSRYLCTRENGHSGPHIAHGTHRALATWEAK